MARVERFGKKYKLRWITKYNPSCVAYTTALEANWEPTKLSRTSTDSLSEAFVKLDRELEWGMSRQLIINVLKKVSISQTILYFKLQMDCMTEDEADAYRKESGYM